MKGGNFTQSNDHQTIYFRLQEFMSSRSLSRKRFFNLTKQLQRCSALLSRVNRTSASKMTKVSLLSLGMFASAQLGAQTFAEPVENPFGLLADRVINDHKLVDLDNDGDYDLMAVEPNKSILYFENVGSPESPEFAEPQADLFGLSLEPGYGYPHLEFVDLDNDGDMDILKSQYNSVSILENIGTAEVAEFSPPKPNPFGIDFYGYLELSNADFDNDGDLDMLGSGHENFFYLENIGTSELADFAPVVSSPFGLPPENYQKTLIADWDTDGDLDVIFSNLELVDGNTSGEIGFYENIGSAASPEFQDPVLNPFNLSIPQRSWASLSHADMDNDGDLDIIIFHTLNFTDPLITYIENLTISPSSTVDLPTDLDVKVYPTVTSDLVNVESNYPVTNVELYDGSGKLLVTGEHTDTAISLEEYVTGMYFVKLYIEGGSTLVKRIAKQ